MEKGTGDLVDKLSWHSKKLHFLLRIYYHLSYIIIIIIYNNYYKLLFI